MPTPSFQIDEELLDEFDEVIFQKKAAGELPRDASRSDILRQLVEEYVEGNRNSSLTPTATAD
ncbi:hypothetical protein BRC81_02895 [Halobacteriales archaeon QS_1_68_20]|nr:MAG: hypothetical protein BRC81_02895 [Halobacteriales archaeon QS_1_68_20]